MKPLAERMRPTTLDAVIGQTHLLSEGAPIFNIVRQGFLPSLILHGSAGIGKTTLAMLLADAVGRPFRPLSAVSSGVKELRDLTMGYFMSHLSSLSMRFIDLIKLSKMLCYKRLRQVKLL